MSNIDSYLWLFSQFQSQYLISHQSGFPFKASLIIITSCPTTQGQALMTSSMYFRSSRLIAHTHPTSPHPTPTAAYPMHFSWMMLLKLSFITWSPCSKLLIGFSLPREKVLNLRSMNKLQGSVKASKLLE